MLSAFIPGSAAVILLLAIAVWSPAHAYQDTRLTFAKNRWYNPSLVEYQDSYISAIKVTTFKRAKYKTWWVNNLFMCQGSNQDVNSMKCNAFNPWRDDYHECEFDTRIRGGKLDTTGLGDVKVWHWPGHGVYAIFGRKPERTPADPLCSGLVIYHQFIAQVRSESSSGEWYLEQPLKLSVSESFQYPNTSKFIMEKNWMPFPYTDASGKEHLFVIYSVVPQRIFEIEKSGAAVLLHENWHNETFVPFRGYDIHGGPPIIQVSAQLSGDRKPYYLGIMHHIERFDNGKIRLYRHFAFKFEPQPPFRITAVSDELPLTFFTDPSRARTAFVAYVSGLFLSANGTVYITYGSADIHAHLLTMSVPEIEGFFTGAIKFTKYDVPYEPVPVNRDV